MKQFFTGLPGCGDTDYGVRTEQNAFDHVGFHAGPCNVP